MPEPLAEHRRILHYRKDCVQPAEADRLVVAEAALVVDIVGGEQFTIMRTPGHETELIVGFLLAEGIIDGVADVATVEECSPAGDRYRVRLARPAARGLRNLTVGSSCGLCGRTQVAELVASLPKVEGGVTIAVTHLYAMPTAFKCAQVLFVQTGGSHGAGLFNTHGEILVVREDLGRHNALDKAIGWGLGSRQPLDRLGAFLSSRISLEMVVKAARARIGLLAAAGAASSLAIGVAEDLGITLCGFVRGDEVAIYTHPHRIV